MDSKQSTRQPIGILTHLIFFKRPFKFCTIFASHNTDKFLKDVHSKPNLTNEFYQLNE
jgi:hypothetical protein